MAAHPRANGRAEPRTKAGTASGAPAVGWAARAVKARSPVPARTGTQWAWYVS
jgi:hypothetical protein